MRTLEYNNVPLHYINYVLRLPVGNTIGDYNGDTKIKLSLIDFTSEEGFDWTSVKSVQILGNPFYCADCDNIQEEETNEAPSIGNDPSNLFDNIENNNSELQPIPPDTSIMIGDMISRKGVIFKIGTCGLNVTVISLNDNGENEQHEIYYGSRNEFRFTLDLNKYLNNMFLSNIINNGELIFYIVGNPNYTASEFQLVCPIFAEALQFTCGKKSESLMSTKTLYDIELINNFDYSKICKFAFDENRLPFDLNSVLDSEYLNLYNSNIEYTEEDLENYSKLMSPHMMCVNEWNFVLNSENLCHSEYWNYFATDMNYDVPEFTYALLYEIQRTGTLLFTPTSKFEMTEEHIQSFKLSILVTYTNTNVINALSPVPAVINIDEEFTDGQSASLGGNTDTAPGTAPGTAPDNGNLH